METNTRLHPLLSAAAISVIVLSVAGVGALTGLLPKSVGSPQNAAPSATALPAPAPAPEAMPAKKPIARAAAARKVEAAYPPKPQSDYADEFFGIERGTPGAAVKLPAPVAQAKCLECGTVEAVREIEQKAEGSGLGAVAGGVGGAILGNQFGKGNGRTIMTILGAAGGAYAGNEIEKQARGAKRWEVSVRLDDGSARTVSYDTQPAWRAGERIRYLNGAIVPEQRS